MRRGEKQRLQALMNNYCSKWIIDVVEETEILIINIQPPWGFLYALSLAPSQQTLNSTPRQVTLLKELLFKSRYSGLISM